MMILLAVDCAEGWMAAERDLRGKSGLPEATVPGNSRAGEPDGKRHRKKTARIESKGEMVE